EALNVVRNRVGLPDRVTADQATARTYLQHEREIEFFGEDHRWYDIRRWMICEDVIENVYEMKIKEFENGDMEWLYDLDARVDDRTFDVKNYWLPVSRDEINKAPQLQQNPGY
ncbi:MAG TPA: RagB/SusD family nutrient uptake outer membrane protein, partial [Anaerovoracaceae bacterium]|nr:RagB/SusD family nutrient uptake outer membrane protein [Anaerovoracaceae bacterium]